MTVTDFNLRLSIWSLEDMSVHHIKSPKFSDKGMKFSSEGKFLALAEKWETKDYIGIYYTNDWTVVNHFATDTMDLGDLTWNDDDTAIIVQESYLTYGLLIYSPTGSLLAKH